MKNPFAWLYDEKINYTPSIAGSSYTPEDSDYEPGSHDISLRGKEDVKREFRQWLASTNYRGRWRSTENYRSLSKHDQIIFRNQMKSIFRHVLEQFASTDADIVWDDIIDDEFKKPGTMKGRYVT